MLPPFIIEQIRKRENEGKDEGFKQPTLDICPPGRSRSIKPSDKDVPLDDPVRGVIVLDI